MSSALLGTLFVTGIDKSRYPEFRRAFHALEETFRTCALEVCGQDARAADALMAVTEATAHGHAMLLLDVSFHGEQDPVGSAADQAASATLALIKGRIALRRPSLAGSLAAGQVPPEQHPAGA